MTDNRTNEPNKYAGFLARQEHLRDPWLDGVKCLCGKVFDLDADHALHQVDEILGAALEAAALVATQGAAPQAEGDTQVACAVNHAGGVCPGYPHAAPVLPSSGVDEDDCWHEANCRCIRAGVVDEQARTDSEWRDGTIIAQLAKAEAERDAALAAIERVREIAERSAVNPLIRIAEILAALDGRL